MGEWRGESANEEMGFKKKVIRTLTETWGDGVRRVSGHVESSIRMRVTWRWADRG